MLDIHQKIARGLESAAWWRYLALHLAKGGDDEGCAECLAEMRAWEKHVAALRELVVRYQVVAA